MKDKDIFVIACKSYIVYNFDNFMAKIKRSFWKIALCGLALVIGSATALWLYQREPQTMEMVAEHVTTEGWIRFLSPDQAFGVDFPKTPEETSRDLSARGITLPFREYKSDIYSVSHVDLPKRWGLLGTKSLLKSALNVLVEHDTGAELVSKEFATLGKHTTLNFEMKKEDKQIKGCLLLIGSRLYRLAVTSSPEAEMNLQFLSSFQAK